MQQDTIKPLDDEARLAWLRLIRSENVGPVVFRQLLDRFGSPAAALSALPEVAARAGGTRAGGKRRIRVCSQADAEAEMTATMRAGASLLAWCEPAYPALLRELEDAPPLLIFLGDAAALSAPAVGIVGARNASANGRRFAQGLAAEIAEAGYAVVSGMARGIDTAAHLGALPRPSVAVLAGGVDVVYPPENDRLHRDLQEKGAVISEMPLGTKPQARHFPRRNRLISGLSCGLVIVEAARRSGSLITARFAAEQGRDVFAVPGSPLDPRAAGCNHLIREGATLVESAAQILDDLRAPSPAPAGPGPKGLHQTSVPQEPPALPAIAESAEAGPNERRDLEELLGPEPIMVDELVRLSGLPIGVVHSALLDLELAGRIERHPGNRVARLYKAPADLL